MRKNDIIAGIIIIPIVLGIVFGIAFFLFFRGNADVLLPIHEGTVFAYHDEQSSSNDIVDKSAMQELKSNDNIGTMMSGDISLIIKYDSDYSNLLNSVSLEKGSNAFGDTGCAYLNVYAANIDDIDKNETLSVESIFGNYKYRYVRELTADSEYGILTYSPNMSKGLIIYYQLSDGAGLSSEYKALVFEEAE